MTHLDEGTLQAFLDHELTAPERAAAAEHLLTCDECHTVYEALMQASALFSRSVAVLDAEPARIPAAAALRRRARAGTATFVKAAGLVLVVAAAASAAVPGSPVRAWITNAVQPTATTPPVQAPEPGAAEPEPVPAAPAGVAMAAAAGELVVALSGLDGTAVRLEGVPGERATVSAVGGERDPSFRTRAGLLEVRGAVGGTVRVGLPLAVSGVRLEVDGRRYAVTRAGRLEVLVPADTVDGAILWP